MELIDTLGELALLSAATTVFILLLCIVGEWLDNKLF